MSKKWSRSRGFEYFLLAIITVIAGLLRFYNLHVWSFWIDEYISLEASLRPYLENLSHPFWIVTRFSLDLFGISAVSLRLPPFIFGVLSIFLLYFPFKAIFDRRVALLTCFLMAISPWHIYISQLARWYSLLLLVSAFSLISFYFYVERHQSLRYLIISVLLFAFSFLLHLTAGFIVLIGIVYLALLSQIRKLQPESFSRKKVNIFFVVLILGSILLVPRFLQFVSQWNQIQLRDGSWGTTPISFVLNVLYHLTPTIGFASFLGLILLLFRDKRKGLFIAVYAVLPALFLIIAASLEINISNKYLFFTLPALLLAASCLCWFIIDQTKKYRIITRMAVIGLMALPSLKADYLYFTTGHGNRDRLNEAIQFIQEKWRPTDRIFPLYFFQNFDYTQLYLKTTATLVNLELADEHILKPETVEDLDLNKRIWVVSIGKPLLPNSSGFYKWVSQKTNMAAEFQARKGPKDNSVRVYLHSPLDQAEALATSTSNSM